MKIPSRELEPLYVMFRVNSYANSLFRNTPKVTNLFAVTHQSRTGETHLFSFLIMSF